MTRKKSPTNCVKEFHQAYGLPILKKPTIPSWDRQVLRQNLILEETSEYVRAVADENLVEIADALGDLIYVVIGAALEYGIPIDDVVAEIHRSNMTKLDENGKPIYREDDGKVLKGPNYEPPNIASVLNVVPQH